MKIKLSTVNDKEKAISTLRKFFRVSNIAFNTQRSVASAVGRNLPGTKMEQLHKAALIEIEKESPSLETMDNILSEMEILADQNNANKPIQTHITKNKKF